MCQISSKLNNFQRKRAGEEKSGQSKKDKPPEMLDLFCFQSKNFESRGNVGSWYFTFCLVIYLRYVCAKIHPNPTTFGVKGLARKKWSNEKAQTSRDARTFLLPMTKSWVNGNVGSWDFTCSLVNYLHYVCAKIHPTRTTFRVKVLARKKVVKPKRSIFTRCSTYSASKNTTSIQKELKKLKLCM